jgi:hypothetical protein
MASRFRPRDRLVKSYPNGEPRDLSLGDLLTVPEKLPAHLRVDLFGMAEPWLNPGATASHPVPRRMPQRMLPL